MPRFFSSRVDFMAHEDGTIHINPYSQSNLQQNFTNQANLAENVNDTILHYVNDTIPHYLNLAFQLFRNNIPIVLITVYLLYKELNSCKCPCPNTSNFFDTDDSQRDNYYLSRDNYYLEDSQDDICPISSNYGRYLN